MSSYFWDTTLVDFLKAESRAESVKFQQHRLSGRGRDPSSPRTEGESPTGSVLLYAEVGDDRGRRDATGIGRAARLLDRQGRLGRRKDERPGLTLTLDAEAKLLLERHLD